jgi:hypothetical protein
VQIILLALALSAPATALAKIQTARLGNVTARFSFDGGGIRFSHLRVRISVNGRLLYDRPVRSRFCQRGCAPLQTGPNQSALRVVDLAYDGRPEVVLSLFTEGAHCCVVEQVYGPARGGRTYVKSEHDFGNAGTTVSDLEHDRRFTFVSADNAFFSAFTSYAASGGPLQVWTVKNHRFVNVTRAYPDAIAKDARRWWRMFTANHSDGEGFIAAWAADQELLGHAALVDETLASEAQRGHLHTDLGAAAPSGEEFAQALRAFLRRHRSLRYPGAGSS